VKIYVKDKIVKKIIVIIFLFLASYAGAFGQIADFKHKESYGLGFETASMKWESYSAEEVLSTNAIVVAYKILPYEGLGFAFHNTIGYLLTAKDSADVLHLSVLGITSHLLLGIGFHTNLGGASLAIALGPDFSFNSLAHSGGTLGFPVVGAGGLIGIDIPISRIVSFDIDVKLAVPLCSLFHLTYFKSGIIVTPIIGVSFNY